MATELFTHETMDWAAYDALRGQGQASLDESEAFLEEHPEVRQLMYEREMAAMQTRRMEAGVLVAPEVLDE